MNKKRLYKILKFAINGMEKELLKDQMWDDDEVHMIILKRFGMTEEDYQKIMNGKPERKVGSSNE